MVKTIPESSPDEPRDWDPNHQLLKSVGAPHETAAVLRMNRAGWAGEEIIVMLGFRGSELVDKMRLGLNQETAASKRGLAIHDDPIPKGY